MIEEALGELERRILVVILDEAQNYSQPSLEEVRLLLGLNLPEQPAFALVLIGDEYLLASLKLRNQRALYSRLACQVSLEPWTPAQCAQYLERRAERRGLERVGHRTGRGGVADQRQRRPAPQPVPAGPRGLDRRRHRPGPEHHAGPRASRLRASALRAGTAAPRPRPLKPERGYAAQPSAPNKSPPPTNSTAS